MQKLLNDIKGISSNYIILHEIIYSTTMSVYIPLLYIDTQGIVWIYMDTRVINDLKRIIKNVNKLNLKWFYRSTGIDFNLEMNNVDTFFTNYNDLLKFNFKFDNWLYQIPQKNLDTLIVFDKILEMVEYYNHEEAFLMIINQYEIRKKSNFNYYSRKKGLFLYDPDGILSNLKRSLTIGEIIK